VYFRVRSANGVNGWDGVATAHFGCTDTEDPAAPVWARWRWDGEALRLEVDRYGMYPIFYAVLTEGVAVSDSVRELLALGASADFDDEAMAAFLRLGFFLREDTPFRWVRAMPPGGVLEWRAGRLRVRGAKVERKPDGSIGRKEAVDGFIELFRDAVGRCIPADPRRSALPLSGGRDSRHIALELHRRRMTPGLVVTQQHFPLRHDQDTTVARRLCGELGWTHTTVKQTADPLRAELDKNRRFDCLTDEHAWFSPCAERIAEAGIDTVFDGVAGGALTQSMSCAKGWPDLLRRQGIGALLAAAIHHFGADEAVLQALLKPIWYRRWSAERARTYIGDELRSYETDDNPVDRFMFWNRTRREIAPFMIRYLPGIRIAMPYLDGPLFDFLWNLPASIVLGGDFHDAALRAGYPGFAHVPFEGKRAPAPDPEGYYRRLIRGIARNGQCWRDGPIISRSWLRPRLFLTQFGREEAARSGWYSQWLAWLMSLERLCED
jgi:asparagine synthetase B (glutamine-hydrolysing)